MPPAVVGNRILPGDDVFFQYNASAAPLFVHATIRVLHDDGTTGEYAAESLTFTTDRSSVIVRSGKIGNPGILMTGILNGAPGLTLSRGQFYVVWGFERSNKLFALGQGYLYRGKPVYMGEFDEASDVNGTGAMRTLALGDPAAGADFSSQTVPANARWKLRGFWAQFVAAVAAANRELAIRVTDGSSNVGGTVAPEVVTTGVTQDFHGSNPGMPSGTGSSLGTGTTSMPLTDMWLRAGFVVQFQTYNINGGDNWGPGLLEVEEWLEP